MSISVAHKAVARTEVPGPVPLPASEMMRTRVPVITGRGGSRGNGGVCAGVVHMVLRRARDGTVSRPGAVRGRDGAGDGGCGGRACPVHLPATRVARRPHRPGG